MKRIGLLPAAVVLSVACAGDAPVPGERSGQAAGAIDTTAGAAPSIPAEPPAPGTLPPVADPAPRSFVFLRHRADGGADTVGFEHFAREAGLVSGELRPAEGGRVVYRAWLSADARVETVELEAWAANAPAGAEPVETARGTFAGDSLIGTVRQRGTTTETRVGTARGAIPYLSPSVGLMEQVVRRARALGGDTVEVPMFLLRSAGNTFLGTVEWVTPDSLILRVGASEGHLVVDADLRILHGTNPAAGTSFARIR
jgi:hypothetical protein